MPTYQYACTDCGHRFEEVQAFSDPSLTVCPECGGKLRKVYGSVGVVFKGSGFYRNDSRSGKSKDDAPQPAGAAGSGSGESGSGDSGAKTAGTEKSTPAAAKTADSASSSSTPTGAKKSPSASSGSSSSTPSKAAAS